MGPFSRVIRKAELLGRALGQDLLQAVFPALCPLCGEPSSPACRAGGCRLHQLPAPSARPAGPRCDRCAQALPPMLPDGTRCATCRRRPPRTVRLIALDDYRADESLREWILALKHRGRPDLAQALGRAMAARLEHVLGRVPQRVLFVPVPLHPLRRLQRGYDQARCLALEVAQALDLSYRPLLVRRRWTSPQGAAGSPGRSANVHNAFQIPARRSVDLLGIRVWLVDDVVTSGATIDACAAVLAAHGARRIGVLCLARAGELERFG